MSEATISTALRDRRPVLRWQLLGPVLVTVALAVIAGVWIFHRVDPNTPHGNPDPGGKRLAYLEETARAAVPEGASVVSLQVHRYAWDPGGCDGGAAGWASAEVELTLRPADAAGIDSAMAALHWGVRPVDEPDAVPDLSHPLPARGPDLPPDYVPESGNPYDAIAMTFVEGSTWELDFMAAPAEVPTHSC